MTEDVIELRLPLKQEYQPVLRATVGVIAGGMLFSYDEIIQLRVAVSEAFDLAIKYITLGERVSEVTELTLRFLIKPDRIDILIPAPENAPSTIDSEVEQESRELIRSLMDETEYGTGANVRPLIRMVKYKESEERYYGN